MLTTAHGNVYLMPLHFPIPDVGNEKDINTRISGPFGPKILAPAVGLDLPASIAKGNTRTQSKTHNLAIYTDLTIIWIF